jgi:hypothetical protein
MHDTVAHAGVSKEPLMTGRKEGAARIDDGDEKKTRGQQRVWVNVTLVGRGSDRSPILLDSSSPPV